MSAHVPCMVIASLGGSVVADHDLCLDGLLEAVIARRELGDAFIGREWPAAEIRAFAIPLARITGPDDTWVWAASAWDLSDNARPVADRVRGAKRKDSADVHYRARVWNPGAGPERNQRIVRSAVQAGSASWTCFGDPDAIRELLAEVSHVGSLRRMGHGQVLSWTVATGDGIRFDLIDPGRGLCRPIPWSWIDANRSPGVEPQTGACRAPYWHPAMHGPVAATGERVTLREGVQIVE